MREGSGASGSYGTSPISILWPVSSSDKGHSCSNAMGLLWGLTILALAPGEKEHKEGLRKGDEYEGGRWWEREWLDVQVGV